MITAKEAKELSDKRHEEMVRKHQEMVSESIISLREEIQRNISDSIDNGQYIAHLHLGRCKTPSECVKIEAFRTLESELLEGGYRLKTYQRSPTDPVVVSIKWGEEPVEKEIRDIESKIQELRVRLNDAGSYAEIESIEKCIRKLQDKKDKICGS